MSRIYWDTMLFIYLFEDHPVYAPKVENIYKKMLQRGDTLLTSTLTVGEALTGPIKGGDTKLIQEIKQLFGSNEIEVLPFLSNTAEVFASIRAKGGIAPPDAIHLATAAGAGTDLFLTNDKHLHKLTIPGIHFIAGLDGKLF
ncbi:MAG TPA: PIN domain-containing protein [Alloacidobacterium sp.]|nr:PIN domain-containing protein [Alloacidobacterium sp.]